MKIGTIFTPPQLLDVASLSSSVSFLSWRSSVSGKYSEILVLVCHLIMSKCA